MSAEEKYVAWLNEVNAALNDRVGVTLADIPALPTKTASQKVAPLEFVNTKVAAMIQKVYGLDINS